MEEDLRRLGHAADGTRGEVSQMRYRPGILVLCDHRATIRSILEHAEEELGVRFGAVNSNAGEESVEVVVHALAVFRRDDCELAAGYTGLFLYLYGLVVVCDPAFRAHTTPVAKDSVPYCDVVHIWMALSYLSGELLQTVWESFLVSLKVGPCALKLRLSRGKRLPVVVDYEIGDVDVFCRQGVEGLRYFVGGEILA